MATLLRACDRLLSALILAVLHGVKTQLDTVIWLDDPRRRLPGSVCRWRGSLRRLARRIFPVPPPVPPPVFRQRRRPWNRTPDYVEEQLVRLHVEHSLLGVGSLHRLAQRVFDFGASHETVRKILLRRRGLIAAVEDERRPKLRRIKIGSTCLLWGLDLTLVWLLGFIPVWILGMVDYHGSRLICLRRLPWPTSTAIVRILDDVFRQHGKPIRLLTDNGPNLRSEAFEAFLAEHNIRHSRIRPAHPWTNGRIERLFRTFKETVFRYTWIFSSLGQIDRWCADFVRFYNRDRPHSSYGGLTPDEVAAGATKPSPPRGRVTYFDGKMKWYAFG